MSAHTRHHFVPGPHTSAGPLRAWTHFVCDRGCGGIADITPGIPVDKWRWKFLTWNGIVRENHRAARALRRTL